MTLYRGYEWQCPRASCRRKVKAATVFVLEQRVAAHVTSCGAALQSALRRAVAQAAQPEFAFDRHGDVVPAELVADDARVECPGCERCA